MSHDEVVRDATESGIPRMVGAAAAILPFMLLIQVLAHPHNYRQPAVPVAVWLGMLGYAAWLLPRTRRRGLTPAEAAFAIATAVGSVVLVEWEREASSAAVTVDWSVLGTIWLLALVALSCSARTWVVGGLTVFGAHAVFVFRALGVNPLSLAQNCAAAYIIVAIMAVFAGLRPNLRTQADIAGRRAALASQSAAKRAAVAAVHEERQARLALLEDRALPLLRGIADGTLDPADGAVRQRCVDHADALRHSLANRARSTAGVLAGLEPALRSAREAGLLVEVQVVGDPGEPGPEVAAAALAVVGGVLGALPPHPVTLTFLGSGDDVELYLTFAGPLRAEPDLAGPARPVPAAAGWRAWLDVEDGGGGCLEICWRKAVAV